MARYIRPESEEGRRKKKNLRRPTKEKGRLVERSKQIIQKNTHSTHKESSNTSLSREDLNLTFLRTEHFDLKKSNFLEKTYEHREKKKKKQS